MPIIEAKGECEEIALEEAVVHSAVMLIDKAAEFKGKPYECNPDFQCTSPITVCISLIFPTEADIKKFMEYIESNQP